MKKGLKKHLNFYFGAISCGIKRSRKLDLAIVYSPTPCTWAGVFTTNQVRAACIDENKKLLKSNKKIKVIVINSGNANACTGEQGIKAVKETKIAAAKLLEVNTHEVLIASTGPIGKPLDMKKMIKGLSTIHLSKELGNFKQAASAILTTDKYPKFEVVEEKEFQLMAFAKGVGMIHPKMATMLAYFITDLRISKKLLQEMLKDVCDKTFNSISVDGDSSTNDMAVILTNNTSKYIVRSKNDPLYKKFKKTLHRICVDFSRSMVLDGEGATKIINVQVEGAKSWQGARDIARHIATSTLFKCAIFGSDPNWGRAVARIGDTGAKVNQNRIEMSLNGVKVFKNGSPVKYDHAKLKQSMKKKQEVVAKVNLKLGRRTGSALGCDMTYDYVKLNSAYTT